MCIIVYKPKKRALPSAAIIEACFDNNPHGAGFMYRTDDNHVQILKGFMTLEEFNTAVKAVDEAVNLKKRDVVMHFRISTTGSTIPANTHPFPLSNMVKELKTLDIVCDRAIAHNGILREYASFHNKKSDMSDTMYFAKMLTGVKERFVQAVLSHHADGSRFVYMSGTKTIAVGMEKIKKGDGRGLFVSNNSYELRDPLYYGGNAIVYYRGGAAHTTSAAYDQDEDERWEKWGRGGTGSNVRGGVSRLRSAETNPIYRSWLYDLQGVMSFEEYCNDIDAKIETARAEMALVNATTPRCDLVNDTPKLKRLWEHIPTMMSWGLFLSWASDLANNGATDIKQLPISREMRYTNQAWADWVDGLCGNEVTTFEQYVDNYNFVLTTMVLEWNKTHPLVTKPETTQAVLADSGKSERDKFIKYIETGE